MIAIAGQKGGEVDVTATGRFLPDKDGVLREFREVLGEFPEALHIHRCGEFKDLFPVWPHSLRCEGVLGNIDSDKNLIHERTSVKGFLAKAVTASRPILYDDEGSLAQPTYHGCGRQGNRLLKGLFSPGEVELSCLAIFIIKGKTPSLPKTYNTNSW